MNDQQPFDIQQQPHQQSLNPFLTVWLHPKRTARYVIEHTSMLYVLLLISIGYLGSVAAALIDSQLPYGFPIWAILLLLVIFSPIFGIISTGIYAGVIWLTGKLFKGVATFKELFKALSVTTIPYIIVFLMILIWLFVDSTSLLYPEQSESYGFLIITGILLMIVSIWSFVINIAVVAEAEKFSNWKAFFSILIPTIIISIILTILVVLIAIIIFAFGLVL